jgi:hypothetical protein
MDSIALIAFKLGVPSFLALRLYLAIFRRSLAIFAMLAC